MGIKKLQRRMMRQQRRYGTPERVTLTPNHMDKPRRWNPLHCVPLVVGLGMLVSYMMFILASGGW